MGRGSPESTPPRQCREDAAGPDLPDRQRTLWGAIGWSYELLDESERDLFELMSVFSTTDLRALEAVAGSPSVIDSLASLVDKSLVVQEVSTRAEPRYRLAVNGRFKGGYITRHYGRPNERVHALQMEMCHATYMDEPAPFSYRPDLAAKVQPLLQRLLDAVVKAAA